MLKIRSSFLFLGVALALFSYVYFYDSKQKTTAESERLAKKLFDVGADQIDFLELTNGGAPVVMEKKNGTWLIEKPVEAKTEDGVVEQMLSEIEFSESRRDIAYHDIDDPAAKLKQWGLENPALGLHFRAGPDNFDLRVGRKTLVSDTYYARTSSAPDAPVHLIGESTRKAIDKKLEDLRSRSVFDVNTADVTRMGLRQAAPEGQPAREIEAAKKDGTWVLQKPLAARADRTRVNAWMAGLVALKVKDFISEDNSNLSQYGLTAPAAQIWLQAGAVGGESTLLIGNVVTGKTDEVYAKLLRANTVFTLPQAGVQKLLADLSDVRDRKVMTFAVDKVTGVRVETKGKSIGAVRKGPGWELEAPNQGPANSIVVQEVINRLLNLDALAFVRDTTSEAASFGLDKPVLHLTVLTAGDKLELFFGRTDKKQVYVMTSSEPFVYAIDAAVMDQIPQDVLPWRDLGVISLDSATVQEYRIMTTAARTVFRRTGPTAFAVDVPQQVADNLKVGAQISLLGALRAVRWLGPALPAYALKNPIYRLELFTGTRTVALKVGAPLPSGGRAAQVEGNDAAFELSADDFALLDQMPLTHATPVPTGALPVTPPSATSPH